MSISCGIRCGMHASYYISLPTRNTPLNRTLCRRNFAGAKPCSFCSRTWTRVASILHKHTQTRSQTVDAGRHRHGMFAGMPHRNHSEIVWQSVASERSRCAHHHRCCCCCRHQHRHHIIRAASISYVSFHDSTFERVGPHNLNKFLKIGPSTTFLNANEIFSSGATDREIKYALMKSVTNQPDFVRKPNEEIDLEYLWFGFYLRPHSCFSHRKNKNC